MSRSPWAPRERVWHFVLGDALLALLFFSLFGAIVGAVLSSSS